MPVPTAVYKAAVAAKPQAAFPKLVMRDIDCLSPGKVHAMGKKGNRKKRLIEGVDFNLPGVTFTDSWPDIVQYNRMKMFYEMHRESDRGCVLVAASNLEHLLGELLRAKFKAESEVTEKDLSFLLDRQPLPPLGSFAIRTILASALGLIRPDIRKALDELRSVRNKMAHGPQSGELTDANVAQLSQMLPKGMADDTDFIFARCDESTQRAAADMLDKIEDQLTRGWLIVSSTSKARIYFTTAVTWLDIEIRVAIRRAQGELIEFEP